jgi:hypothetical protein
MDVVPYAEGCECPMAQIASGVARILAAALSSFMRETTEVGPSGHATSADSAR